MSEREQDFQKAANDYAKIAIGNIREMVNAVEHAGECDGTTECPDCDSTGSIPTKDEDCPKCEGTGSIECKKGADSDSPESWHDEDAAHERIQEDALSVEVRSDWHTPGDKDASASEYLILITTGGLAARITGDLDGYGQPSSARFEYQDWGKPWTLADTSSEDDDVMLEYARHFYFGEGE